MKFKQFIQNKSSFNPSVVGITLFFVLLLLSAALVWPQNTEALLNAMKQFIFQNVSWFYILTFSVFLIFLLALPISSLGSIRLGTNEDEPEFSFLSWLAMLFAAGMGVGLMFFGVAEPLSHFSSPIAKGNAQEAILHTVFHWGIHAWAIYGIIALALAYFGFRYKLPLALRSCFYPILKDKINGKMGDAIDVMALIATLFGIITTLGFGATQMGSGLLKMGWVQDNSYVLQVGIIVVVMAVAIFSATSGVGKGVKILSETNLVLALALMLFVLLSMPTTYLIFAFSDNLGTYLSNFVSFSFKSYTYEPEHTKWFTGWTVLYWAWWCSWSPFVGLFIARISRGRTIREFIFGVLAVPSLMSILWFTVFGNSALWLDTHVANGALSALTNEPEKLLFAFLNYLPWPVVSSLVALLVIALFFITSADSGIYVLNNIASRDKGLASPKWQSVMWGVVDYGWGDCVCGCRRFAFFANHDPDCVSAVCGVDDFYDGFFVESPEQRCQLFCNRRQSEQYFLVGRSLEGTPWPNDESDAGSRYHQIYEKYGASGNAGIEKRIDSKIQYGRRNPLSVATG